MPFHPDIATRLPLLEGIPSLEAGLSEPLMRAQIEAFDAYPDAPPPAEPAPNICSCRRRTGTNRSEATTKEFLRGLLSACTTSLELAPSAVTPCQVHCSRGSSTALGAGQA